MGSKKNVESTPRDAEKSSKSSSDVDDRLSELEIAAASPAANPLFVGKLARKVSSLLGKTVDMEQEDKQRLKGSKQKAPRYLRRGVTEVSKALRKGEKGFVVIAADTFPLDVIAHLPIFCEEKDVPYGYLISKKALGVACRSHRPSSVVMIAEAPLPVPLHEAYHKVITAAKKVNPYL